jgi:hypothetical protein
MVRQTVATVIVVCALAISACDRISGAVDGESSLRDALTFAPPALDLFAYTDWTQVREYAGAEDLGGGASEEQLISFNQTLAAPDAPLFSLFGGYQFPDHRATWGWNELDVVWEAHVTPAGGEPATVIALDEDFDVEQVTAKLDERDYSVKEVEDATIYSDDIFAIMGEQPAERPWP